MTSLYLLGVSVWTLGLAKKPIIGKMPCSYWFFYPLPQQINVVNLSMEVKQLIILLLLQRLARGIFFVFVNAQYWSNYCMVMYSVEAVLINEEF